MKNAEFAAIVMGFLAQKIPAWCGEEDTETGHLNNLQREMKNHNVAIREVLVRNNGSDKK